jgi:hypothetical protein
MGRVYLVVEGQGDEQAVPNLLNRLALDLGLPPAVFSVVGSRGRCSLCRAETDGAVNRWSVTNGSHASTCRSDPALLTTTTMEAQQYAMQKRSVGFVLGGEEGSERVLAVRGPRA